MKHFINEMTAYPWVRHNNDAFRGYFIVDDVLYKDCNALSYLKSKYDSMDSGAFKNVLRNLDGVFSFILEEKDRIIFGTDRLRGLPLFYTIVENEIWVGDDINTIVSELEKPQINYAGLKDLRDTCLFVIGSDTLIKGVYQVRAAEFCTYDVSLSKIKRCQYFHSEHGDFYDDNDIETIRTAFHDAYFQTGKNIVKILNGRTAVIPLSGGADSRMIVSMLREQNYNNVICFTYGKPGNPESEMSKAVAKEYGYEWHIIPYSAEANARLRDDDETKSYIDYAFMYCTTPHFQDYYAVRELKQRGIIPNDSVFIPGHSGDIPNGNHVAALYLHDKVTKQECLSNMARFAYAINPKKHEARLQKEFNLPEQGSPQDYASIEEWMDTSERQAKFIVHSTRVYEYFGYEWLIPLWDKTQFDFWKRVSLQWRYKRKLYYYLVNDKLPSTNDMTMKKKFEKKLRTIPGVHQIASRVRRIQNWWISPLQLEHYYSANEYFKACFTEVSYFDFNTLLSRMLVNEMEKKFGRQ